VVHRTALDPRARDHERADYIERSRGADTQFGPKGRAFLGIAFSERAAAASVDTRLS